MKMKLTLMVAMAVACAAVQLAAMPTEEETRKAEPVVKKLLAQERAAFESGKKTRSEVAAAAMKLAGEADTDAAKLLLMKGAFALYVKDGNLEKAVETMRTLEATISDMPPQSVTNMIEMALLGVAKKVDGARLYKLLNETKADILSYNDLPSYIESKAIAASVKERSSVASILKGMIKLPGRDCWLSATELTQGQWESVMGYNPSEHKGANLPVENVSRDDCDVFLEMLNKTKEVQASPFEFRLPSHGEWACAAWSGGLGSSWVKPGVNGDVCDMAWVHENSSNQAHAVATKAPNAFGFYDIKGNVSEWVLSGDDNEDRRNNGDRRGMSFWESASEKNSLWWYIPRDRRRNCYGLRLAAHIRSRALSGGVGKAGSSAPESAQRQAVVDGYTWSYCVKNEEAMIVTTNGVCAVSPSPKGGISIPSTLDGVKVTSIGNNAFRNCRGLTSVTIPSGVTSIEDHVFEGCSELKSVTIPYSVKNIGESAFNSCFALKSVTIPPNVERIGAGAFWNCRGLTSVTIPEKVVSIGGAAFSYCSALKEINVDVENQTFMSIDGVLYTKDRSVLLVCPNAMTSVKIPKDVTHIGVWAFEGCNKLTTVTIPEGVTSIESGAFKECGGLVSVAIPSSVKRIGWDAFLNCKGLKSVTLPEGVCDIGGRAFRGCGELASLTLPKGLTTIGDNAFEWCGKLTSLTLPQGLTEIGRDAFRGLGKLTSVTIPESVTSIGGAPFSYCGGLTQINVEAGNQKYTSVDGVLYTKDLTELVMCPNGLKAVTIPESVTSIGLGAFIGCSKLTSVMLPSGVSHIGEWAFEACNGLTSVTIPESVTKIDKCAFNGCGELTSLTMLGERPDAPNDIFNGCGKLKSIHVPANAKSWEGMKDWNGIPLVKSSLLKPSLLSLRGRRLLREQQRETELKAAGVESVTVKTRKDIDRLFPGWSLDSTVLNESNKDLCSGFHASHRGQNNVLYLHPANRETPVVLSRTVTLSDKNPCLFLKIASWDEGSDFLLSVRVNGKYAMPDRLVCTSDVEPWEDLVVPLFDWRGSLVKIEIVLSANNWWSERAQLARIEIAEGNGQEKYGLVGVEGMETIDGYTWSYRVRNGEVTLVAEKDGKYSCAVSPMPTGDISIPTTLGGVKVTRIGRSAFLRCGGLTSVTIPEGVTSIERDAFYDCNGLKAVTIPTSVKRIGMGAFSGCGGLISATIPEGVTHIGVLSFSRCSGLTSVVIPSGVDVGRRAFSWCYGLKSATISEGVTRIGEEMFRDCIGIKSVTIPEGVTEIGVGAFMGCQELGSVTIPASVTNIEWLAFSGCKALTQINVAEGNLWFALVDGVLYTKDLTELVMCPNGLSSATIQPSVKSIRADAFRGCAKLTAVTIPANVESCSCAFTYCGALKQINVDARNPKYTSVDGVVYTKDLEELVMAPGGVKSVSILAGVKRIGDGAFKGCSTLTSITIPSGVTRILPWTFEGCSALESVTIQGNVTYIGSQAFWACRELTSFTMRGERPYAPNNIFMGCGKLKSIHVPANAKSWAGMKDWLGIPLAFDAELKTDDPGSVDRRLLHVQSREAEREEQRRQLETIREELRKAREERQRTELAAAQQQQATVDASTQGMNVVTKKLQGCDFLLNKDFKKNAKYYLCLFSASWCGPCRAEMPRIAKTYAESLKDDPNIELIHFSRDSAEDKALAWAKEHDVKFPVVRYNGGNPLDLHTRGIPHLFIVKADGTLVEEGHPMKLFTDEKLRELKAANGNVGDKDKPKMASSGKETVDGVEWSYSIIDGQAQVDYALSSNVTDSITIPSTLGGCPVTSIRGKQYGQRGVFEKCGMTSVTIPSSVTSIGDRAFENCRRLSTMTIQSSATSIGSFAFFGCDSLVSLVIPSGVTSVGWRAFACCRGLTSVTISSSVKRIEREAFLSCDNLMSISVESDNPSYSSRNGLLCSKDGSILIAGVNGDVTIPSGVTRIGDGAFDSYDGLTSVTIPSSVTRIGERAFAICRGLTSVTIPSSVTSIGSDAFMGTPFYRNMPDGMVVLGGGVLCGYKGKCPSEITIPSNVTSIADCAFSERTLRLYAHIDAGVKMVVISSSVTNIGNRAFSWCDDLVGVTMCGERPEAPKNIFERCGKLKAIHVPANAKSWAGMKDWQGIPLVFDWEVSEAFSLNATPGSVTELDLGNVPLLQFVYCPAGKFSMGYKEQPAISKVKDVEISSPFWVSKTVIRADQLESLGINFATNSITNGEKMEAWISDASIVVQKLPFVLKERFGKMLPPGYVFRLPTEAEFEYLQKAETNDKDAPTNIWGVERLYSGGYVGLLDRAPAYGRVDVVRRRNHRGVIMTDLVKVSYENQPDKDPVGWTDDPTWSVFRRGLARNCGGGKLVTAPGGGKYHYSFYFVVAPDIDKLNKFYWK